MALARGMDVKTLSATIGHISSATTLDIYSYFTDEMRRMSAEKIERNIGRNEMLPAHLRQPPPVAEKKQEKPPRAIFEPYKGKIRRSGSGGMYQINENLWEGSYTPTLPNGKRHKYNVYAKTQDECEIKLQERIARIKEEIAAEKRSNLYKNIDFSRNWAKNKKLKNRSKTILVKLWSKVGSPPKSFHNP